MKISRPILVVTLPAGVDTEDFTRRARRMGANMLEVRDDITPEFPHLERLSGILPLLMARRTDRLIPDEELQWAAVFDQDITLPPQDYSANGAHMRSLHAEQPLGLEFAVNLWRSEAQHCSAIKHVEPYEEGCEERLRTLRSALRNFVSMVTVLPMGEGSEEARRMLAAGNDLHYCALDASTASAPGQPLLAAEVSRLGREAGERR